jgi:Protein kinase domain/Sulfatase-modifying factor enzyme 1
VKAARILGGKYVTEAEPYDLDALATFIGVDPETLERVVIKEPHVHVQGDEHYLDLFQRAAAQLSALGPVAPRVIATYGRGQRVHAIVLEDVEGLDLQRMLALLRARGERLPVEVAVAIVRELVPLFRSPVRLQLGPSDVMISPEGRVRAIPELVEIQARQTVGAAVHFIDAPAAYLAPETVRGEGHTTASDMYSLGVLLYELIANRHPNSRETDTMFEMLSRIQRSLVNPIQAHRDVPSHVVTFLDRALARDPRARFRSWDDFEASLPALSPEEILAAMPEPPEREPPRMVADWRGLPNDDLVPVPVPYVLAAPPVLPPTTYIGNYVYGADGRPMVAVGNLLVDVGCVTEAEYQRFVLAIDGAGSLDPEASEQPVVNITHRRAELYARWAGKRLPTEREWTLVAAELGPRFVSGEVWEWTATPAAEGGFVVCGGRWRNDPERLPRPENRSYEVDPAADVGFRCVQDR